MRRAASHFGGPSANIVHSGTVEQARTITVVLGVETSGSLTITAILPPTGFNVGGSLSKRRFVNDTGARAILPPLYIVFVQGSAESYFW